MSLHSVKSRDKKSKEKVLFSHDRVRWQQRKHLCLSWPRRRIRAIHQIKTITILHSRDGYGWNIEEELAIPQFIFCLSHHHHHHNSDNSSSLHEMTAMSCFQNESRRQTDRETRTDSACSDGRKKSSSSSQRNVMTSTHTQNFSDVS